MSTTAIAVPEDDVVGLEDIEDSDLVVPRMKIIGKDAQFEDQLTNERFDSLDVVLLALVKNRILWDADEAESEAPWCKSLDGKIGLPDVKDFPWKASSFDPAAFGDEPQLPCGSCPLKDWGSHPKDDKPWCSEMHVYPLLVINENGYAPALLSLQRASLKASKAYVSPFARAKMPLYTARTRLTLTPHKRGSVQYATPVFTKLGATDDAEWPDFASQARAMREFIQTVRSRDDVPAAAASSPAAAASGAPAAAPLADDDPVPF